jgi:RNA polymerase sigma-70 factor (ECF subfamily)
LTEKELIQGLREGDELAFRMLVNQYRNRLYYVLLNLLQDAAEAEDALQETFIQVYQSIGSFREESGLYTWVYRIATRKALERMRKQKNLRRVQSLLPWWMPDEKKSVDAVSLNPGIQAERRETANALFRAIKTLPENQRLAFTLIRIQGMDYEEVCKIMGLGVKAVESLMSRAKENLKRKLKPND